MANVYHQILLKVTVNQIISAVFYYQTKDKKHRLSFDVKIKSCPKPETSLAEISSVLINEIVERINQLQHRFVIWTHLTLRFQSSYPRETYRINLPSSHGRLDGTSEERFAVRFELQESGTTQTRWVNLFGAPKGLILPNENVPELNQVVTEIERILLGREIGIEKFSLQVTPTLTSKTPLGFNTFPLSCTCRGVYVFPIVKRQPRRKKVLDKTKIIKLRVKA